MSDHSVLAPSAMARTVQCPGSVTLAAKYPPREDSDASREGTAAHWVLARYLHTGMMPAEGVDTGVPGFPVSADMIDGAYQVSDYIEAHQPGTGGLHIEERIPCESIHPLCWGTPDIWYRTADGVLAVIDYKFGFRPVSEFENCQLVTYTSGIMDLMGVDGLADQSLRIDHVIIQPRAFVPGGTVRVWHTVGSSLRGLVNSISSACHEAMGGRPSTRAGEHCYECAGRHVCPAIQAAGLRACDLSRGAVPHELEPRAMGLELEALESAIDILQQRRAGMVEEALYLIRSGTDIPGWSARQGEGRKKWTVDTPAVLALGAMWGIDLSKPACLTPRQAIQARLPADVVDGLSARQPGEIKLTRDDGSRARRAFNQITGA